MLSVTITAVPALSLPSADMVQCAFMGGRHTYPRTGAMDPPMFPVLREDMSLFKSQTEVGHYFDSVVPYHWPIQISLGLVGECVLTWQCQVRVHVCSTPYERAADAAVTTPRCR